MNDDSALAQTWMMMAIWQGQGAAPGQARGLAWRQPAAATTKETLSTGGSQEELARFRAAVAAAQAELESVADTLAPSNADEATIFVAHQTWLVDPELIEAAEAAIEAGRPAIEAWRATFQRVAQQVAALPEAAWAARAADVWDVGMRVLRLLEAGPAPDLPDLSGWVVLAQDATASQMLAYAQAGASGVALAEGSMVGHGAILARALGLPLVIGLGDAVAALSEGETLVMDGDQGTVRQGGAGDMIARHGSVDHSANRPIGCTMDGHPVEVWANAGSVAEVKRATGAGAQGIGLLRTEFLFLGRETLPDQETQHAWYEELLTAAEGLTLVARTLDPSPDKPLPGVEIGWRGIRASRRHPDLFRAQVRAMLAAAVGGEPGQWRMLLPMVTDGDDWRWAQAVVRHAAAALGVTPPPLGVMIETPAAVWMMDAFMEADFFSIGSNDLAALLAGVERERPEAAACGDGPQPALLRAMDHVTRAAHGMGKTVSLCGELAGQPALTALWVGLGMDRLSVAVDRVGLVGERVSQLDYGAACGLAARCLACLTVDEVYEVLRGERV